MYASGVDRGSCIRCAVTALLLVAFAAIASEAIAGTPLFNRPLGEVRGTRSRRSPSTERTGSRWAQGRFRCSIRC